MSIEVLYNAAKQDFIITDDILYQYNQRQRLQDPQWEDMLPSEKPYISRSDPILIELYHETCRHQPDHVVPFTEDDAVDDIRIATIPRHMQYYYSIECCQDGDGDGSGGEKVVLDHHRFYMTEMVHVMELDSDIYPDDDKEKQQILHHRMH